MKIKKLFLILAIVFGLSFNCIAEHPKWYLNMEEGALASDYGSAVRIYNVKKDVMETVRIIKTEAKPEAVTVMYGIYSKGDLYNIRCDIKDILDRFDEYDINPTVIEFRVVPIIKVLNPKYGGKDHWVKYIWIKKE
jgi:hypothetical protein